MKRIPSTRRLVAAAIAAVTVATPLVAASPASAEEPDFTKIAVPAGNKQFMSVHATGVQIYSCNATATGYAWALLAPRANLYDNKGRLVGTHFGGPTWKANDGSTVVGKRVDGITVDATAIQWLLIKGDSWTTGTFGDRFTNTSFVQRLATTGGLQPSADTCTAERVTSTKEVAYTADYTFWKKSSS